MKLDSSTFPQLNKLTLFERFLLRTCCYLPRRQSQAHRPGSVERPAIELLAHSFGREFVSDIQGKDVLDFGCGKGEFVLAMARVGAARSFGLDIQDSFDWARRQAEAEGLTAQVELILGDSQILPDESFDCVISHDAFEHFENPERIYREMVRITRSGGRIYIKFGPPWKNPWGRHMSGTFRKDRPWLHLLVSERSMMRVHSVYHNTVMLERYAQRPGGLNQMTLDRFAKIVKGHPQARVLREHVGMVRPFSWLNLDPFREYFASSASAIIEKE